MSSNTNMKQIKEKPSFWKKLGLGKVSHKKSEDQISVKGKQLSHAPSLQHISTTPAPTPISTYSTTLNLRQEQQQVPPLPIVPRNSSLKHSATIHSTSNTVNGVKRIHPSTTTTTTAIPQQEAEKRYYTNAENKDILNAPIISNEQPNATPLNLKHAPPKPVSRTKSTLSSTTSTSTSSAAPPSTTTSTVAPSSTTSSASHDNKKKKKNKTKAQSQDQAQVLDKKQEHADEGLMTTRLKATNDNEEDINKSEQKMMSSFVMVEKNNSNPKDEDGRTKDNESLWQIISTLRKELENEKATVQALQKQKEAVAKDLNYFEMTIDELYGEKTQLIQQLEEEKTKSQGHLEELNILLEKMKSNADNARDKSFALDQVNADLKKTQDENKDLHKQLKKKEKSLNDTKKQLKKFQDQADSLKEENDSMKKEVLDLKDQCYILEQANELLKSKLHHQSASVRGSGEPAAATTSEVESLEIEADEERTHVNSEYITGTDSSARMPKKSKLLQKSKKLASKEQDKTNGALDVELDKLLKEKEKLQSSYSKIPLTGGGPQSRRRKEELEEMLDQVDSQLSRVKQKIKRT